MIFQLAINQAIINEMTAVENELWEGTGFD